MNADAGLALHRGVPSPDSPEIRVVVHGGQRFDGGLLDHVLPEPPTPPSIDAVRAVLDGARGTVLLTGGEPTLRPDLPRLVRELAERDGVRAGLITDGLALAAPKVAGMLRDLGLGIVRIRLACAHPDAHEWLFGQPGTFKRVVRAIKAVTDAGLRLEFDVPVTRPTRPFLPETVEFASRVGASRVFLRRVSARGITREHDVTVVDRLGLLQADVERAVQRGARDGLELAVEGFPRCAVPGVAAWLVPVGGVDVRIPRDGAWRFLGPELRDAPTEAGCARCPGPPACAGAPEDYVRRFGRAEIDSEGNRMVAVGSLPPTPRHDGSVYPPPREGRAPASRVAYVRKAAAMPALGDDPMILFGKEPMPPSLRVVFLAPARVADPLLGDRPGPEAPEPTRGVRIRLVQAAQHGVPRLRIASAGSLAHPDAAELLREAVRLQFAQVEAAGELSAMAALGDLKLRRLRGLTRLDAALYAPDAASHDAVVGVPGAFDATLDLLDRAASVIPGLSVGAYAVLRDPAHIEAFAAGWADGSLPGDPWFRLAPTGGSLRAAAEIARSLGDGPAFDALAAVLPVALLDRGDHVVPASAAQRAWGGIPASFAAPSGSDCYGCYAHRLADPHRPRPGTCPGYAEGWNA